MQPNKDVVCVVKEVGTALDLTDLTDSKIGICYRLGKNVGHNSSPPDIIVKFVRRIHKEEQSETCIDHAYMRVSSKNEIVVDMSVIHADITDYYRVWGVASLYCPSPTAILITLGSTSCWIAQTDLLSIISKCVFGV
ncbi:hypothetical protein J6590_023957 [Homalodisca vitripennis]|nr:hypothetical protein J6590_023957 [Homalodisca vitripennis]